MTNKTEKMKKRKVKIFNKNTVCCNCRVSISEDELHASVERNYKDQKDEIYCIKCFFSLFDVEVKGIS